LASPANDFVNKKIIGGALYHSRIPFYVNSHVDAEESPVPDRSQTLAGDARLKAISIPADPAPSASPTKTTDAVQTDAHGNAHHQHENKSDAAPSTSQEQ